MKKIFIFGHCRNMLCRLLPHSSKDITFLDCTGCTDSGESRKPCKASYKSWQSRNVFAISQIRLAHAHISSVLGQLTHPKPSSFIKWLWVTLSTTNNGSFSHDLFLPIDRSDRANDRRLGTMNRTGSQDFLTGLRGFVTCFFPCFLNFTLSGWWLLNFVI